jgi:hypothetical protein
VPRVPAMRSVSEMSRVLIRYMMPLL